MVDAIESMLEALWVGHDVLRAEMAGRLEPGDFGADPERTLTSMLHVRTVHALGDYRPFTCRHEHPEPETRQASPAQSPTYDIAFVLRDNERIAWPVEAKVVATDRTVATYVREIHDQYLTCRYAPFSTSGAMLAYIERGSPEVFQSNVEKALGTPLQRYVPFATRHHRVSDHGRQVPAGRPFPADFQCHHLAMVFP
ncbi:hypothetical protein ACQKJ1_24320 [Methylorubrum rhodesianum]|uniref:hypothetical protein n=1 Tax=Methylorubrum rhodesianum TaxID=29427 RepID=UPI003D030EA1